MKSRWPRRSFLSFHVRRGISGNRQGRETWRDAVLNLRRLSFIVFIVSARLALLAVLVHYAHVSIPMIGSHVFDVITVAYIVLLIGVLFRGI